MKAETPLDNEQNCRHALELYRARERTDSQGGTALPVVMQIGSYPDTETNGGFGVSSSSFWKFAESTGFYVQ